MFNLLFVASVAAASGSSAYDDISSSTDSLTMLQRTSSYPGEAAGATMPVPPCAGQPFLVVAERLTADLDLQHPELFQADATCIGMMAEITLADGNPDKIHRGRLEAMTAAEFDPNNLRRVIPSMSELETGITLAQQRIKIFLEDVMPDQISSDQEEIDDSHAELEAITAAASLAMSHSLGLWSLNTLKWLKRDYETKREQAHIACSNLKASESGCSKLAAELEELEKDAIEKKRAHLAAPGDRTIDTIYRAAAAKFNLTKEKVQYKNAQWHCGRKVDEDEQWLQQVDKARAEFEKTSCRREYNLRVIDDWVAANWKMKLAAYTEVSTRSQKKSIERQQQLGNLTKVNCTLAMLKPLLKPLPEHARLRPGADVEEEAEVCSHYAVGAYEHKINLPEVGEAPSEAREAQAAVSPCTTEWMQAEYADWPGECEPQTASPACNTFWSTSRDKATLQNLLNHGPPTTGTTTVHPCAVYCKGHPHNHWCKAFCHRNWLD